MTSTPKKICFLTAILFLSATCLAETVFWTFPPSVGQGVLTTTSGTVSLFKPSVVPYSPAPAGIVWEPCNSNFIILNKKLDGTVVPSVIVNQVLANLLFAQANGSNIRIGIARNSDNDCFGSQIFQTK